jgi:glycosyltransferase involved in cell wall biosynthesis
LSWHFSDAKVRKFDEVTELKTWSLWPENWSSDLTMLKRCQPDMKPTQVRAWRSNSAFLDQASQKMTFTSVGSFLQSQIPILIPTFNNPTYLRKMLDQLSPFGFQNIVIVDNCSDYPSLLSYLRSLEGQLTIIYQTENKGPRDVFIDENLFRLLPEYFCLTDPDLEFNAKLPSDFVARLISLTEAHRIGKAGFSLDISEPEDMRQEDFVIGEKNYKIWEWEAQYWLNPLPSDSADNPVYRAAIDTTFAVYNKKFFKPENPLDALRVAGDFTCRHLPWYRETQLPAAEEAYYRTKNKFSFYLRD